MSIVIKGCNVFDPIEKSVSEKLNVVITGDRIEELCSGHIDSTKVDRIIDAHGCTVIPGLINLHSHPQRRHARFMEPGIPYRFGAAAVEDLPNTQRLLWAVKNTWIELLEDGVTTMRAAGSKDYLNIELRNVFNEGMFKGPRIISTGPILAITGGHGTRGIDGAMEVDGADEMRRTVRAVLKAGADWIKLCISGGIAGIHKRDHPSIVEFSEEEVRTAVDEAHKRYRKVMVHGMAAESVKTAVRVGVDCIEHGNLLDDEAIKMMKQEEVPFVPTMSGIHNAYERERVAGHTRIADMMSEVVSPQKKVVSKCIDAGILIGTGTDTLGHIHQEVQMLVECGMSRVDTLCAATINSAKILGLEEEIGSVERGKKADLLVLEGNPVEDLMALKKIREVIIGGELANWEFLINAKEGYRCLER